MKIGVITFYNAFNYGAFWQAKALCDYIKFLDSQNEVYVIKTGLRRPFKSSLYKVYDFLIKRKISFKKLLFDVRRFYTFSHFGSYFEEKNKRDAQDFELCIFGSDEIWNIKRKVNRKALVLWGKGINPDTKKVSYAPTINDSTEELFRDEEECVILGKSFVALSARDKWSCEILSRVLSRNIQLVVDPTLLHKQEYYLEKEVLPNIEDKYILLYSYGNKLKNEDIEYIINLKKKIGCKLINVGNYVDFVDECILCSPMEFLGYYHQAEWVITDTFHGIMFSTIYRKKTIIINSGTNKVNGVINQLGLSEMCTDDGKIKSSDIIIDYDTIWEDVTRRVINLRSESEKYLKSILN